MQLYGFSVGRAVHACSPPGGSRIVPTGTGGLHCQDAGHTLVISPASSLLSSFPSIFLYSLSRFLYSLLSHFQSQNGSHSRVIFSTKLPLEFSTAKQITVHPAGPLRRGVR